MFERVKKEPKPPIRARAVYQWCATNTDCRLSDWQVNRVNIVVKCPNRFQVFEKASFRDKEPVSAYHNNVNLMVYLPVCKSAVCVCCTPVKQTLHCIPL